MASKINKTDVTSSGGSDILQEATLSCQQGSTMGLKSNPKTPSVPAQAPGGTRVGVQLCAPTDPGTGRNGGSTAQNDYGKTLMEIEKKNDEELEKMKKILKSMGDAMKRQPNINKEVKDGKKALEDILESLQAQKARRQKAIEATLELIVCPPGKAIGQPSIRNQMAEEVEEENITENIRKRVHFEENEWTQVNNKRKQKPEDQKKTRNLGNNQDKSNFAELTPLKENIKDKQIGKGTRKWRKAKQRNEAILIKPAEGKTYAEVLGAFRKTVNPNECGADVTRIRSTKAGCVLVELAKTTKDKEELVHAITTAIGATGKVQSRKPRVTLEVLDLEALADETEVEVALREAAGVARELGELKITMLPPNKWKERIALVEMDESGALLLLGVGSIRVGWIKCRIRRRIVVQCCYKCLGYGHTRYDCKGPDRSGLCRKCGKKEHRAKDCKEIPKCVLCSELNLESKDTKHVPGSGICRVFRQVLHSRKNNRR